MISLVITIDEDIYAGLLWYTTLLNHVLQRQTEDHQPASTAEVAVMLCARALHAEQEMWRGTQLLQQEIPCKP